MNSGDLPFNLQFESTVIDRFGRFCKTALRLRQMRPRAS